jgi:hypothetical protein
VRLRYAAEEIKTVLGAVALLQRTKSHAMSECRYVGGASISDYKSSSCAADPVRQLVSSIGKPLLHRALGSEDQRPPANE